MALDDEDTLKHHLESMRADQETGLVALPRITAQQRHYVAGRVSGLSMSAAGREAGVTRPTAGRWEQDLKIQQHMDHYLKEYTEQVLPRIAFGIEQAHMMYMNAYHSAGTSAEMTRATDSLVKLHKLTEVGEGERGTPTHAKQLESLDTQQLLRYAAIGMDTLKPGDIVDGEFTEDYDRDAEQD